MAVKSDGTLWGWGRNSDGELGLGYASTDDVLIPQQVTALTDRRVLSVSAGGGGWDDSHTLAITAP